jgi:hypothetical protein
MQRIAERTEALQRGALEALQAPVARLSQSLSGAGPATQELQALADAIRHLHQLGQSRLGQNAKAGWARELQRAELLYVQTAACVDMTWIAHEGTLHNGILHCRNKPWRHSSFETALVRGLMVLPSTVHTSETGEVSLDSRHASGPQAVTFSVRPLVSAGRLTPKVLPQVQLPVATQAAMVIDTAIEDPGVRQALGQLVERKFGARVVPRNGNAKLAVQVVMPPAVQVGAQWSQSIQLHLTALSEGASVWRTTIASGGLQGDPTNAKAAALSAAVRKISAL